MRPVGAGSRSRPSRLRQSIRSGARAWRPPPRRASASRGASSGVGRRGGPHVAWPIHQLHVLGRPCRPCWVSSRERTPHLSSSGTYPAHRSIWGLHLTQVTQPVVSAAVEVYPRTLSEFELCFATEEACRATSRCRASSCGLVGGAESHECPKQPGIGRGRRTQGQHEPVSTPIRTAAPQLKAPLVRNRVTRPPAGAVAGTVKLSFTEARGCGTIRPFAATRPPG